MAMPTLEKTYEFFVNHNYGGGMTDHEWSAYSFWKIKDRLVNWSSNPWTVVSSSNKSIAGAADYWLDYTTDVNWGNAGYTHSWIVLERPTGGQLLLDCKANASTREDYCALAWSNEGLFTGGSTTNCPTAADEQYFIGSATTYFNWSNGTAKASQLHMIHSTDGEIDHILMTYNGTAFLYWSAVTPICPVSDYTLLNLFWGRGNDTMAAIPTAGNLLTTPYWRGKISASGDGTGKFTGQTTALITGYSSSAYWFINQSPTVNDFSNRYPMYPMALYSDTAGYEGRHCSFSDMWLVKGLSTGDTLEENALSPTYEFAVFNELALPWNGTLPEVA